MSRLIIIFLALCLATPALAQQGIGYYKAGTIAAKIPGKDRQYVVQLERMTERGAKASVVPKAMSLTNNVEKDPSIIQMGSQVTVVELDGGNALVQVTQVHGSLPVPGDNVYVYGPVPPVASIQAQPNAAYRHGASKGRTAKEETGPSARQESLLYRSRLKTPIKDRYQERSSTTSGRRMSMQEAFRDSNFRRGFDSTGAHNASATRYETTDMNTYSLEEMARRSRGQAVGGGLSREGKVSYTPDTPARLTVDRKVGFTDGNGILCARARVCNRGGTASKSSARRLVVEWRAAAGNVVATDIRPLPSLKPGRYIVIDLPSGMRCPSNLISASNYDTVSEDHGNVKPEMMIR